MRASVCVRIHFSGAGDLPTHMTLIWADSGTRMGVQVVCLGGGLKALCGGEWAAGEKSGYLSFNPCFSLAGNCYGDVDQPAFPAPSVPDCSTHVAKKAPRQGDAGRPHLQKSCHWWSPGLGGGDTRGINIIAPQMLPFPQATGAAKLWTGNRGWRQPPTKRHGLRKDLSPVQHPRSGSPLSVL